MIEKVGRSINRYSGHNFHSHRHTILLMVNRNLDQILYVLKTMDSVLTIEQIMSMVWGRNKRTQKDKHENVGA